MDRVKLSDCADWISITAILFDLDGTLWKLREKLTRASATTLRETPTLLTDGEIIRHHSPLAAFQVSQRI